MNEYATCYWWRCADCGTTFAGAWDPETETVTGSDKNAMGCPWCGGVSAEPAEDELQDDVAADVFESQVVEDVLTVRGTGPVQYHGEPVDCTVCVRVSVAAADEIPSAFNAIVEQAGWAD